VCYALSTTATGGFSVHNAGVFAFGSDIIEFIAIFFQFLSGMNFMLIFTTFSRLSFKDFSNFKDLAQNSELKFYVALVAGATVVMTVTLVDGMGYSWYHAFRAGLFQTVSFVTTTGLYSENVTLWPEAHVGDTMLLSVHRSLHGQHERRTEEQPVRDACEDCD